MKRIFGLENLGVRKFFHGLNPQEATQWLGRLALRLKELGEENFQKSVVSWLTHSFLPTRMPNIELQELHTIEQIIMSIDNNTMDWSVQYIEQGREEGRAVGREEGREEGQLTLILQLLTRKFGPLPSGLKTKLEASDGSTLNKLADAFLDLNSIEDLKSILD
jgi:flagellar biosynthesis/type III secretory pathway protein FliH